MPGTTALNHERIWTQTCPKYCPTLLQNMSQTRPKHSQSISKTCQTLVLNMSENDPRHAPNMLKSDTNAYHNPIPKNIQNTSKIDSKSTKMIMKMYTSGTCRGGHGARTGNGPGALGSRAGGWTTGLSGLRCSKYRIYPTGFIEFHRIL